MMTDWNAVSAFMANVVTWPGSQTDPGYVNLHYSMEDRNDPKKKKIVTGWPTRDVGNFVQKVGWAVTTNYIKDLWFCTSLQSQAGKNSKGNAKAIRGSTFALKQKSIWVDIDVEPNNPKKYATVEEALAALLLFAKTVGLPKPSAIVFSGGGIHVYWISKDPLTPTEWQPYASGLKTLLLANAVKCDSGLTTDIARILRVPGTLNHKYDPPKPVQLSPTPLKLYDFDKHLSFLKSFATLATTPATPQPGHNLFAEGADIAAFKKGPAFKVEGPDLNAGIDRFSDQLLKAEPIFKQCDFMKHALKTEGADYDNPLWNLSVLCSTFMENGNAIAHAISKGHVSYTPDDTQALYDRKVAERHDRGLGYPQCTTIQGAGCAACASCPLLSKGKSPLNIRPAVTATVNPAIGQSQAARALDLPTGFDLNDAGIICKVIEKTSREGETSITLVPLFQCILTKFWVQKHPDCLNYTVTVDKGFTHDASVPHSEMSKQGFRSFLGLPEVRTLINVAGSGYLEEFYLSMLGKLRDAMAAQQAVPFGWYRDGKTVKGFVYGGNVMEDNGSVRPCGIGDAGIKRNYTPCGDISDWYAACKTVTDRKRPDLTAIMLIGFASPLLSLEGHDSILFSVYGDSAAGKSSAYKVGMSIWGHPKLTKGSETSTRNNITTQMSEIRNLPFYWDEIASDKYREMVAEVMHEASDGVQKGRNLTGQKTAIRGQWELMIAAAGNQSFREYLHNRNSNHAASLARVLEWRVARIDNGPGQLLDADATAILADLNHSYGMMGLKYAHFLATNHKTIHQEIKDKSKEIQVKYGLLSLNRYWIAGATMITLAAKYARQMGVDVDPAEIERFMVGMVKENIDDMAKYGMTDGVVDNTEMILSRYFSLRFAEERMIWTNYMHNVKGKPPRPVVVLKGPQQARNTTGGIEVRWAVDNEQCIIAQKDFAGWCALPNNKFSLAQAMSGLHTDFGARFAQRMQVASGTVHGAGQLREPCIVIPIKRDGPLWDMLVKYLSPDEKVLLEAREPIKATETGFEFPDDENSKSDLAGEGGIKPPPNSAINMPVDEATGLATPEAVQAFTRGATGG